MAEICTNTFKSVQRHIDIMAKHLGVNTENKNIIYCRC